MLKSEVPLSSPPRDQDKIPFEIHTSPVSPVVGLKKAFASRRTKMGRNPM